MRTIHVIYSVDGTTCHDRFTATDHSVTMTEDATVVALTSGTDIVDGQRKPLRAAMYRAAWRVMVRDEEPAATGKSEEIK